MAGQQENEEREDAEKRTRKTTQMTKLFGDEDTGYPFVIGSSLVGQGDDDKFAEIQSISVHADEKNIHAISVQFSDGNNVSSATSNFDVNNTTKSELNLGAKEYIHKIDVRVSSQSVACLTFYTDQGRTLGPCGDPNGSFFNKGTQHTLLAPRRMKLVEMFGKCTSRPEGNDDHRSINAIGFRWGPTNVSVLDVASSRSPSMKVLDSLEDECRGNNEDSFDEDDDKNDEDEEEIKSYIGRLERITNSSSSSSSSKSSGRIRRKSSSRSSSSSSTSSERSNENNSGINRRNGNDNENESHSDRFNGNCNGNGNAKKETSRNSARSTNADQNSTTDTSNDYKQQGTTFPSIDVVYSGSCSDEEVNVITLVEIVSAWDLSRGDTASGTRDAYVTVSSFSAHLNGGDEEEKMSIIHRTNYIPKTISPVWTVRTGSLFLLKSSKEIKKNLYGLDEKAWVRFEVWNYDGGISLKDHLFGRVDLPISEIIRGKGERMEYSLKKLIDHSQGIDDTSGGTLALRFRPALDDDIRFVESLQDEESLLMNGVFNDSEEVIASPQMVMNRTGLEPPTLGPSSSLLTGGLLSSLTKPRKKVDKVTGETKFLVRPGPDPERIPTTEWMTAEEIEMEVLQPSTFWIDAGSGCLGTINLEILKCDGLPNMDNPVVTGQTDAFICVVYEDVVVCTDVVDNCLSPRWMPWTKRAMSLRMMHPSSRIYLAVMDYDDMGPGDYHDFIGRVAIDVTNLLHGMEYTLQYALYASAKVGERTESRGTITVRLSLDPPSKLTLQTKSSRCIRPGCCCSLCCRSGCCRSEQQRGKRVESAAAFGSFGRTLFLASLSAPPKFHVHTKRRKEFRVARYAVSGEVDVDRFSLRTMTSYVAEIMAYRDVAFHLEDALWTVLLWKGHYQFTIFVPRCCCFLLFQRKRKRTGYFSTKNAVDAKDEVNDKEGDDYEEEENNVGCCCCLSNRITRGVKLFLPLHSMVAFTSGIVLVEHPRYLLSFLAGLCGWILLAIMGRRRNHPSPWKRCRTYRELLFAFFRVSSSLCSNSDLHPRSGPTIQPFENEKAIREHDETWQRRLEHATEQATIRQKRLQEEREQVGVTEADESTKEFRLALSLLEPYLLPLQVTLGDLCKTLQIVRSVVLWDECYYAFWLTTICFASAVIFAFIPWGFLIHWFLRIVVWACLGPWMALLDICCLRRRRHLRRKHYQHHNIGRTEQEMEEERRRLKALKARIYRARLKRENAIKTKDTRNIMFGTYATQLPRFKIDRDRDMPLPASSARRKRRCSQQNQVKGSATKKTVRVLGQHLVGDMIPKRAMGVVQPTQAGGVAVVGVREGEQGDFGDDEYVDNGNDEVTSLIKSEGKKSSRSMNDDDHQYGSTMVTRG